MNKLEEKIGNNGVFLRKKIASLARKIILREPPYNQINIPSCYERYRKYVEQKDLHEQELLLDAFVKKMEFIVCGELCRDSEALSVWGRVDSQFQYDFLQTYVPPHLKLNKLNYKEVKGVIVNGFLMNKEGFCLGKAKPNMVRFYKEVTKNSRLFVEFDMGSSNVSKFNVYLSLNEPAFSVELSSFLCLDKRVWSYEDSNGCDAAVSEVSGLVELVLPDIESIIKETLTLYS